jgi:hypothetical protein
MRCVEPSGPTHKEASRAPRHTSPHLPRTGEEEPDAAHAAPGHVQGASRTRLAAPLGHVQGASRTRLTPPPGHVQGASRTRLTPPPGHVQGASRTRLAAPLGHAR